MPVDGVGPTRPPAWIGSRVAHPAGDLARSTAYYRDLLGLQPRGGFTGHDGYDGVFFGLPGGGELELTAGPVEPTAGTEEDLLVLYVRTMDEVRAIGAGLVSAGVRSVDSPNPYWNRCGQTFLDPDGYRIVIAAAAVSDGDPREQAVGHDGPPTIDIDWHVGAREELRPLFELAEDSRTQLDEYLYHGKVLLARRGSATVGHLQLVPTTRAGEIELKNMAVVPDQRGTGVGRALVASAVLRCGAEGWSRMVGRHSRGGYRESAFLSTSGLPLPLGRAGCVHRGDGVSRCHRHRRYPAVGPGVALPGPARPSTGYLGLAGVKRSAVGGGAPDPAHLPRRRPSGLAAPDHTPGGTRRCRTLRPRCRGRKRSLRPGMLWRGYRPVPGWSTPPRPPRPCFLRGRRSTTRSC